MSKLFRYGGVAASIVLIAFGIGAVVIGVNGRDQVRTDLAREQIVGTPDSTIPGQKVDTGSEAQAFAKVMRKHTLEATGGQTYAQMGQFLDKSGKPTSDEKAAAIDPKTQKPVSNPARQIWVTETALTTALNTAYFAENVALFAIVVGIALMLTGVGFLVFLLIALRRPKRPRPRPAGRPRWRRPSPAEPSSSSLSRGRRDPSRPAPPKEPRPPSGRGSRSSASRHDRPEPLRMITADYPRELETDVVLRDGSTIRVRPVRATDRDGLLGVPRGALARVALVPLLLRRRQPRAGRRTWAADVDYVDRLGLVATVGEEERIVAHAVSIQHGRRTRGGRVRGRRRAAGPRRRDDPARPPRRPPRATATSTTFTAIVLPGEPPDAAGVPRQRLSRCRSTSEPGLLVGRAADVAHAGGEDALRGPRPCRRGGRGRPRARARVGRAHRRVGPRRARSARRSRATSSPAGSPATCTSSTAAAARVDGQRAPPVGARRRRVRSISPSSPVPAAAVVEVARECARKGVRRARRRLRRLRRGRRLRARNASTSCSRSAAPSGMRLVGPNCLGVLNTRRRG